MITLVINAGSSSLKFQLIDMSEERILAKGSCERIGNDGSLISYKTDQIEIRKEISILSYKEAFLHIKNMVLAPESGVLNDISEINAIGHRVVQGGDVFYDSCLVNEMVIEKIKDFISIAPLHTPINVLGIESSLEAFGKNIPQVVVFDTSFYSGMPEKAYMYAIPYEYYKKYGIRRHGYHGISYRFVSVEMARRMGKDISDLKLITCHIGNGSSVTAIDRGVAIDTTCGFTTVDGLMMGTRSGTLDPSVVTFIEKKENLTPNEMDIILNKKSGFLGVSGVSSDDRDITIAEVCGNKRAKLSHEIFYYQIAKYIGAFYVALGGCDGIVFTGGLGENQPILRRTVCDYLKCIGVDMNYEANEALAQGKEGKLSTDNSKIRVELIATDEEIIIARDTKAIVQALQNEKKIP